MKHILLIFFSLFFVFCQAQKQEFIVGFGPSVPLGSYAKKDLSQGDGFADVKGFINVEGLTKIKAIDPFGFFMTLSYQQHNIDELSLGKQLKPSFPNAASLRLEVGDYASLMGAFGLFYRYELDERWVFNTKVGIGATALFLDPIYIKYQTYSDDEESIVLDTQGEVALSYYVGSNVEYRVGSSIGVHLNVFYSFAHSDIAFKDISSDVITTQNLQYLNIGSGITVYY